MGQLANKMIVNEDNNSEANKTGQREREEVREASPEEALRAEVAPRQSGQGSLCRGQRRKKPGLGRLGER